MRAVLLQIGRAVALLCLAAFFALYLYRGYATSEALRTCVADLEPAIGHDPALRACAARLP